MIVRKAACLAAAVLLLALAACSSSRYQPVGYPLVPPSDYASRSQRLQPVEGLAEPSQNESVDEWTSTWMKGPVSLIATEEETEIYGDLSDENARAEFIRLFWERRDPEPGEPHNEYLSDVSRRSAVAGDLFAVDGNEGWQTPFGIAMVALGFPTIVRAWDADDEEIAEGEYVEAQGGYRVLWQYGLRPEDLQGGTSLGLARLMSTPTGTRAPQTGRDPFALNFIYTAGSWRMSCQHGWFVGGRRTGSGYAGPFGRTGNPTVGEGNSPDVAGSGGVGNSNPFGFAGPQGRANPAVFHPGCADLFGDVLLGTLRNFVLYP